MPDSYRYTGHPGESLASGRALVPYEEVPAEAVDPKNDHDQALIDEGRLLPIDKPKKSAKAEKETAQ